MTRRPYNGFPADYRDKQGDKVYKAFRNGTLERPTTCIVCGLTKDDGAIMQAHNEDYHRPFNYVGICYFCHMAVHRRYQAPTVWIAFLRHLAAGWTPPTTSDYGEFIRAFYGRAKREPGEPVKPVSDWAASLPLEEPDLYNVPEH